MMIVTHPFSCVDRYQSRPAKQDETSFQPCNQHPCTGKFPSTSRRRVCIEHVRQKFRVSERRARRVLGQQRST